MLAHGNSELENGATRVRLNKPQFASVAFGHSNTNSEPQSRAARFRRKERIKYALSILDRNSGSGVLNRQQYGRAAVEARREPQTSCFRDHRAHRVLSSWATTAVTASMLKSRLARSRRCKMMALARRE